MKVRTGFVSNSSSSSFCIFGTPISSAEYEEYDERYKELQDAGLEICSGYEEFEAVIGIDPGNIEDDKTLGEARQEVAAKIAKFTGDKCDPSYVNFCTDGGYGG